MGCLRPRIGLLVVLVVATVMVGYVGVTYVQVWMASNREQAPAVPAGDVDAVTADAIVVLGAAQWDGKPSPVFQQRLDHAAGLYNQGVAPAIVVTGGKQDGDRVSQGLAAYEYLRALGVPDEALLVEVDGRNTFTELSATSAILAGSGRGSRVVLVTDGYHARRTALVAQELGLDPLVSPSTSGGERSQLMRETGAVAVGRIIGFRRLSNLG